jgi:hypothetical protein
MWFSGGKQASLARAAVRMLPGSTQTAGEPPNWGKPRGCPTRATGRAGRGNDGCHPGAPPGRAGAVRRRARTTGSSLARRPWLPSWRAPPGRSGAVRRAHHHRAELTRRRWLPCWRAHHQGRAGAVRRAQHRPRAGAIRRVRTTVPSWRYPPCAAPARAGAVCCAPRARVGTIWRVRTTGAELALSAARSTGPNGRGRDGPSPHQLGPPPAQIPASAANALGSCLGS